MSAETPCISAAGAAINAARPAHARPQCFHCGTLCRAGSFEHEDKSFCCRGCLIVFELLTENGLTQFYQLNETAGVRVSGTATPNQFHYLDEPAVRERLVDYADAKVTRVTFLIPTIHCIACVWLLENLFRLKTGIGQSQVNFLRKELAVTFDPVRVKLSEVVALLASLGYEPELKLSALDAKPRSQAGRRMWIQLGVAGFAFGNIMLFSLSAYLGLDAFAGPGFRKLVGAISLLLALPVVIYSAADYWRAARMSLRQRVLNIDVPIAVGIAALFAQSSYELINGLGAGYFDSLTGLIFFLLCGRLFQQKTYDRLAFDRDYKSFFPLSVTRKERRSPDRLAGGDALERAGQENGAPPEAQVSLAQLVVGDHLIIRNGELIPADARLVSGPALIDYSFVTGESEPVARQPEDHLYAGGRQMGGAHRSRNREAGVAKLPHVAVESGGFPQGAGHGASHAHQQYSQRFTQMVIAVAIGAALFWAFVNPTLAVRGLCLGADCSVPVRLGAGGAVCAGHGATPARAPECFSEEPRVLETLAKVDAVVFDKTGTLTAAGAGRVTWCGREGGKHSTPKIQPTTPIENRGWQSLEVERSMLNVECSPLTETEERWLYSMTRHSTHPLAVRDWGGNRAGSFP